MRADFEYVTSTDGFTSIMPNTPEAVAVYKIMYSLNGVHRLMPQEFAAFKSQARRAGYSVRKAKRVFIDDIIEKLRKL
jgi:hypothetical protein